MTFMTISYLLARWLRGGPTPGKQGRRIDGMALQPPGCGRQIEGGGQELREIENRQAPGRARPGGGSIEIVLAQWAGGDNGLRAGVRGLFQDAAAERGRQVGLADRQVAAATFGLEGEFH